MPRYFITTFDRMTSHHEEGVDLPDLGALDRMMRRTLAHIALEESREGHEEISAEAQDEGGRLVMSAALTVMVTKP